MRRLLATVFRKAVSWLTGKFLAEVLVSAVATVTVTAVFSGSSWTSQTVRIPSVPAQASRSALSSQDAARISFDGTSLAAAPETFVAPITAAHARHLAATIRAQQTPTRLVAKTPPARPAPDRAVSATVASATVPSLSEAAPRLADATGSTEPRKPAAPPKGFTVFGVSPTDLVPSGSAIMGGMSSVGHTIADLADLL